METPAGRSRFERESIVLGEGSIISIRRLCTRVSKCSCESLSVNGDLRDEIRVLLVGSGVGPIIFAPVAMAVSRIFVAASSITL